MLKPKRLILGLSTAAAVVLVYAGCGDDETTAPVDANCAPTDPACAAISNECLALTDNSDKNLFHLRLAQLTVNAPPVLTSQLVGGIVSTGVNINLPACNIAGDGTFSLITEFDLDAGKLRVGGALPEADPSAGYCFLFDPPNFRPVEVDVSVDGDGNFETGVIDAIRLPIFSDMAANEVIELPLREAHLIQGKLSADHNCIGSFNADGLQPRDNCKPVPSEGIFYYIDDGTLEGYVTLEEADTVYVEDLDQTLCVLLSGDPNAYAFDADPCPATASPTCKACIRDGMNNITLEGDWCSTTNSAGGCKDSFRLSATFAASAVSLKDNCPADPTTGPGGGGGAGGMGGAGGAGGN